MKTRDVHWHQKVGKKVSNGKRFCKSGKRNTPRRLALCRPFFVVHNRTERNHQRENPPKGIL
ncbi:CLUMA_CG010482, isoform A [Clunio marinus]|uniref:CLUMA_CG010482, isoform A n=1 Tax=Clunio marinus TaxID=568069 RepID=A0A1J1I9Y4_9DIPT|nr:CLUMA_CG010482, isoform A [Clunio marinus]